MPLAKRFYDTNALLNLLERAFEEEFICSYVTLNEIEDIKTSGKKDEEIKYKARKLSKLFDKYNNYKVSIINYNEAIDELKSLGLKETPDNLIMLSALNCIKDGEDIVFVTDDICCKNIARDVFCLTVESISKNENDDYKGFTEVELNEEEMAYFYSHLQDNIYDILINEYLIIKNELGEVVDKLKWDGETHLNISYKNIDNTFVGKVKPRNLEQILASDLLQDEKTTIKVITGGYGTGKDFLMISNAINMISKNKYDNIIWIRNTVEVKDSKAIGFLPGSMLEKLKPFAMILADHLGGELGLDMMLDKRKIQIEHLGFIRGRSYKNSIIMCSEAENLTKEHIQLLIGRVGEGSTLWLNGDFKQNDGGVFSSNNGLLRMINKLQGHKNFGFVKLNKVERSETASMADLLD